MIFDPSTLVPSETNAAMPEPGKPKPFAFKSLADVKQWAINQRWCRLETTYLDGIAYHYRWLLPTGLVIDTYASTEYVPVRVMVVSGN